MCETIKACIAGCAKCILIIINIVALVGGLAMIGVGSYVLIEGDEYIPDVGVDTDTSAIALIVLGVLILMIGCFGCFGAITGKHGLLNVYLIGLLVIIIIELGILIYGFVNKAEVSETVTASISGPFEEVNTKGSSASQGDISTVDSIQVLAKCCGIDGPEFYKGTEWVLGKVPASCCKDSEDGATKCDKADAYTEGCLVNSEGMVSAALSLILYILIAIIVLQVICMILAWCSRGDYQAVDA